MDAIALVRRRLWLPPQTYRNSPPLCTTERWMPSLTPLELRKVQLSTAEARAKVQARHRANDPGRGSGVICPPATFPALPCGTVPEILADEHFRDRGALRPMRNAAFGNEGGGEVDELVAGFPVLFDGQSLPDVPGAPSLGMHNAEVLGELCGVDAAELERLRVDEVV